MVIRVVWGRCGGRCCRWGGRNRLLHVGGGGVVRGGGGLGGGGWGGGVARVLVGFQLAEAAVDGALDAAFVSGELGEGVGTLAIHVEGAGQEVALVGRGGRGRYRIAVFFGVPPFVVVLVRGRLFTPFTPKIMLRNF